MRYSSYYLPTLREGPSEAEVTSHKLMLRAGMIRKLSAGIYSWLPLGLRCLKKVEKIIREEMNREGALELFLPSVQPAELWQESGRWDAYGRELLRFKDRHQRDFCLGPTHEEVITALVRGELRSYRQLPVNLYQIQTKFRDEIRPRFGVMRAREFGMKDAYSFDVDEQGAELSYQKMFRAYTRIFARCGLKFKAVEALTGPIGGSFSHEFMVLSETGEDILVSCKRCGYSANLEKAEIAKPKQVKPKKLKPLEKVYTPAKRTVEEVCEFLNVTAFNLVKCLIYESAKGAVAVLIRGDRELNTAKLEQALEADWVEMASPERIQELTGGPLGFSGPIGLKIPVLADYEIKNLFNMVIGANELDHHYVNANIERDFYINNFADLRIATDGDPCPKCGAKMRFIRGIEVGHTFKLGTKYSRSMNATFLDPEGKERFFVMGCYGIGTGRTVASAIEQNNDEKGIIWPFSIAPFQVYLLPINYNDQMVKEHTDRLELAFEKAGIEVLVDDRDETPGVKFKDADLIGIPLRIVVGERTLKNNSVEFKLRKEEEKFLVELDKALPKAKAIIRKEIAKLNKRAEKLAQAI